MTPQEPLGPFCQSCSMPLDHPADFGTDASGHRVNEYCRHCFQGGRFTEPEVTLEQMIDRCSVIMAQRGIMPLDRARGLLGEVMPRMKRWCKAPPGDPLVATGGRGILGGDPEC
jgi:hypothetical protein